MKLGLGSKLAIVAIIVAAVALAASFPIRASYASRAKLTQRMRVNEGDQLFADEGKPAGTPVGSPQMVILDDPSAFLNGVGEGGARLLDEHYLERNRLNPLQLQTVDFYIDYGRLGSLGVVAVGGLCVWIGIRRAKRK